MCRVYDIDEIEGSTFLSMEYVDGEDLASLLRRVGSFPEGRALEIARQICAGLASAHERGVIHRDLKPANVMLDGAGKVRITDFGLAGASGEAIRAGTPAYMAPEQLAGHEVTARSDIYSLGLLLYELFTGQRALEGKNLAELIQKREQAGIPAPTTVVKTLDPQIETAVMRCLNPQPDERPPSALAVAAALPGGDPLAAALAAGETPSPDMVAAAGQTEALHLAVGLALVATIVAWSLSRVPPSRIAFSSTRGCRCRSRSIRSTTARATSWALLGYPTTRSNTATGLSVNFDVIAHISRTSNAPDRWDQLNQRTAPVMLLWHRSSPEPLVPAGSNWRPTVSDPSMNVVGMTKLFLDDTGRLVEFEAVPPRAEDAAGVTAAAPWPALFAGAGLDMNLFREVPPQVVPRSFATERAAWEGPLPGVEGGVLHVEAAAHRGKAVSFKVTGPWEPIVPGTTSPVAPTSRFWPNVANAMGTIVMFATLLLARSNLRAGRGDRRGAWRLFCFALTAMVAAWIVSARHYPSLQIEDDRFFEFVAHALLTTGTVWLLYIALEPFVRRYAPAILISWTRVLSGQIVDPRVGRDVLIGVAIGVAVALLGMGYLLVPGLLGGPPGEPRVTNLQMLLGARAALGALLRMIPNNLQNGLFVAVAFGVGRALTKRVWGGALLAGGLLSIFILGEAGGNRMLVTLGFVAAFVIPLVAALLYFGLLPRRHRVSRQPGAQQLAADARLVAPLRASRALGHLARRRPDRVRLLHVARRSASLRTAAAVGLTRFEGSRGDLSAGHIIADQNGAEPLLLPDMRRGDRSAGIRRRLPEVPDSPAAVRDRDRHASGSPRHGRRDATRPGRWRGVLEIEFAARVSSRRQRLAAIVVNGLALILWRDRPRPLRARHPPRRPLPDRRATWPRRDGRSVSC